MIRKIKFKLLPILLSLGAFAGLACQLDDGPFSIIIKKLEAYNQSHPQEKVHLHLDKPYYAVGDDIWFKAYIINAQTTKLSTISDVLYVELINEKDSVIKLLKLPVISGVSWGNIRLPDYFTEGNYRIRSYTQWMRNSDPDFFFDKTIKIGNSWTNSVFTNTTYSYHQKQQNGETVESKIKFIDKSGIPYIQREVTFEVQLDSKSVKKGKTKTNEAGEISISFSNKDPALYKYGKIIASLSLPDHTTVIKEIPIVNTSNNIDVQFFPESGNLVENFPNKLGIKAVNSAGLGEDISGTILDNQGNVVTKFSTEHLGMGNVILTPQPGKTYVAKVKYKDGSENTLALPKALRSGYILSVDQNAESILVKVLISEDLVKKGELKLIAQHNGNIYFISKADNSSKIISASLPKKNLPSGIFQLTLFSIDNMPICERLIFVNNSNDKIITSVSSAKRIYAPKEEVELEIETGLINKQPTRGSFSVAVTNTSAITPDELNESNIFTSLLLTSDLTGFIEKPNYYFLNENEKMRQDLDNLMLSQGWRKILWKNIINDSSPAITYQPEKSLKISGIITTKGGKPLANSKVSLLATNGSANIDTLTDSKGRFNFDRLNFVDSTKFIIQASKANGKSNLEIKLDADDEQLITKNKNTGDLEVNVNEAISSYLKQSKNYFDDLVKLGFLGRTNILKEVNIVAERNPAKNSSNLNGPGKADAVITSDQLQVCSTIAQCIDGKVAGLIIKNGIPYLIRNGNTPMQVILDGVPMDNKFLSQITLSEIQTIEILKDISKTAVYGKSASLSGVLIITTKRPGDDNFASKPTSGSLMITPKGYNISKEFYSPNYKVAGSVSIPDHRSTIYWNPNIITSESGKAKISYFNADDPGTYRVVIEGMDMLGNLCRSVYTYQVK